MSDLAILEDVFDAAIHKPPADRASYLNQACASDPPLRRQIEKLLAAYEDAHSFLESPAVALEGGEQPTAAPQLATIGTRIGPYKLLEQIGEGGMGLVYMAEQQHPLRRLVALKLVKPGMDSKQVIARFDAERQALAVMDHPHIAKVLDAGTTDAGRPYFVMELVRGLSIVEFCDQKGLSVRQRLELFVQVCQAVQHAHQKGIIHRDLKPTNILITMADSVAVPKVIDFGIAKALGQSLTEHTLHTGYAQLVGTPLYMSPEQAELNQFGIDTRSDVYSLGVLLYELLTGTTPFDKETLTKVAFDEMRRIIREQEPPRPSVRVSTLQAEAHSTVSDRRSADPRRITTALRGELDWIVMKALAKERSQRYESASSFAADIVRYLNDEPVLAFPPSTFYRFRKFARKHRAAFTTATVIAASLLLGTTLSLWQAIRATAAEAQATANEKKARGEEQKALAAVAGESAQRKQAEKSLEAALKAVDQMLATVNDEESNEIPRIGPLRRKLLSDASGFLQRIPISAETSPAIRFSAATTWQRVAQSQVELDEYRNAKQSYEAAILVLAQLTREQPQETKFRSTLAETYTWAGWNYFFGLFSHPDAERCFRSARELNAELARMEPKEKAWTNRQARAMGALSEVLIALNRREEALVQVSRALEMSARDQHADRGQMFQQLAMLHIQDAPDESDNNYLRAIDEFRAHYAQYKTPWAQLRLAQVLDEAAGALSFRHPEQAEKFWEESTRLWREICGPAPRIRQVAIYYVRALIGRARHLRLLAARHASSGDSLTSSDCLSQAAGLYDEAIRCQRKTSARFQLGEDRFDLAGMIAEQAAYLLGDTFGIFNWSNRTRDWSASDLASLARPDRGSPSNLQADALLTEAIQLCRALAAEFADNAANKDRLAELLKLQAQHFSQPAAGVRESHNAPTNASSKKDDG